jgi:hypothetical protein
MIVEADCPNCGAPIRFRSAELPIRVCDYCRTAVLRTHGGLQAMGRIAEVPEDVSPLRIGTRGKDDTHAFELVGRIRWRWADGAWNEWLALFDDGSTAWLGEAMGRFMLLHPTRDDFSNSLTRAMAKGNAIAVGTKSTIQHVDYVVTDVKQVSCVGSEGELPFSAPLGLTMLSVDLMSRDGRCASIQKDRGSVLAYTGRYVSLADIAATELRAFEGWPMPQYSA